MSAYVRWGSARFVAVIAALAFVAVGCRSAPPQLPPERVVGEVEDYVIGVPDVLMINVWKQPEISGEVTVRPDGKISLALLQDVQAEGLTPDELRLDLTERLAEFIVAPQVNVIVRQMNSHTVSVVGGGVGRNGVYPLQRNTRVLDAVALAGGFTAFAKKGSIRVLREQEGVQVEYRFDYDEFIAGRAPESNLLLEPGDTIVVPD